MSNRILKVRAIDSNVEIDPSVLEKRDSFQIDFGSGIFGEPSTELIINEEQFAARLKVMSEQAYEQLQVKDPATFYFLYEDE